MLLFFLLTLTGFEHLLVDPIADRMGMGYALFGDGHNAHYNPAGLVLNTSTTYSASYMNYIAGTHFGYLDYENRVFGAGIKYFYSGKMKKTDATGQEFGDFSTNFIDLNIGKGIVINNVIFGVCGRIVYQLIDTLYALGIGTDIGMLYSLSQENIQLGITAKNLGASVKPFIKEREYFPVELGLGAARYFSSGWIGVDILHSAFNNLGIRLGGEYAFNPIIALRASYNSTLSQTKTDTGLDFLAGISIGFGVKKGNININYSYTPYFALGQAHRLTIKIGG